MNGTSNALRAKAILDRALAPDARDPVYLPDFSFAVRQQVMDLLKDHPVSLKLKQQEYTYNDGRTLTLLLAAGTVPMFYGVNKYNLPLAIWLPERFPLAAPIAYVTPTPDMVINQRCPNVEPDGLIRSDYSAKWSYPGSNLRDYVGDLCIVFNNCPPLYAAKKPEHPAAAAAAQAAGFHATNPLAAGAGAGTAGGQWWPQTSPAAAAAAAPAPAPQPPLATLSGWAAALQAAGMQQARPPPPPPPPPQPQQSQAAAAAAAAAQAQARAAAAAQADEVQRAAVRQKREAWYREALSTALAARLAASLDAEVEAERERQARVQRELQSRGAALCAEVAALQGEREGAEVAAGEYAAANAALGRWLAENEPRAQALRVAADGAIDPDEAIVAADPLSAQALLAQSADLALEDAMAALDKALEGGVLQPDAFVRQIRVISRRQFTARAVSKKIAAKQAEAAAARPPPAAASPSGQHTGVAPPPPPPPPAQMPIGDLWHSTGGILLNPLASAANNMKL